MRHPTGLYYWTSFVYYLLYDLLNVSSLTQSLLFADDTSTVEPRYFELG